MIISATGHAAPPHASARAPRGRATRASGSGGAARSRLLVAIEGPADIFFLCVFDSFFHGFSPIQ